MQPEVVGRDEALGALDRVLGGPHDAIAGAVIDGPAGIGKSLLCEHAVLQATESGYLILRARPSMTESNLAFLALRDLLQPVIGELPTLPSPQRRGLEVALHLRETDSDSRDPSIVGVATLTLLRQLATVRRIVLVLDDTQWLDPSSAVVLHVALRRLAASDVRVVAAHRPADTLDRLDLPTVLGERLERIPLGPLPAGALHHLIRSRLGVTLSRPSLIRLHEATRGNPYHALSLVRTLGREIGAAVAAFDRAIPADLREHLDGRLKSQALVTRDVVLAAAIAAHPTSQLLAAALGLPESVFEGALRAGVEAGLLVVDGADVDVEHPLLASVARVTADPVRLRRLHARLAELVDDPVERAQHVAGAAEEPRADVAAALEDAARRASARGGALVALNLYEQAIAATPAADVSDRGRRRYRRAEALFITGDTSLAHEELERALREIRDDDIRLEALLLLATVAYFDGDARDAAAVAERALASTPDRVWQGRFHSRLGWICDFDIPRATAHSRAALELLDPDRQPGSYAFALLYAAAGDLELGRLADHDAVRRARDLQDRANLWDFGTLPGLWPKYMDRFDEARTQLGIYLDRARQLGDEPSTAQILGYLGELELWAGNLDLAERELAESISGAEQAGQPGYVAAALPRRAMLHAYRGDLEAARRDAEEALTMPMTMASPPLYALALGALGFIELSSGATTTAAAVLGRALGTLDDAGYHVQPQFRFQGDLVEALIAVGELERAAELIERLEQRAALGPVPWARAVAARGRALLAAAHGDLATAVRLAADAVSAAAVIPFPLERGRTHLAAGQILRRAGQRLVASAAFDEAAHVFAELGAATWLARVETERRRLGLHRGSREELSPSELRIAQLAASGLTNRQVADKLFVSPKTVEANLMRAYSKLGIHSRAELGQAAGRLEAEAARAAELAESKQGVPPARR